MWFKVTSDSRSTLVEEKESDFREIWRFDFGKESGDIDPRQTNQDEQNWENKDCTNISFDSSLREFPCSDEH